MNRFSSGWFHFNAFSLSTRFTVVFLTTSVLCLMGFLGLCSLKSETDHIASDKEIYGKALLIKNLMLQHRRYEKDIFLNIGDREKQADKYVPKLEAMQQEIQTLLQEMHQIAEEDPRFAGEVREIVSHLASLHQTYMEGVHLVSAQAMDDAKLTPQAANQAMKPYKEAIHDLEEGIDRVADFATQLFEDRIEASKQATFRSQATMLLGMVLAILPWPLVIFWVVRPLRNVAGLLNEFSHGDGDLTRRLPTHGKDEICQLGQGFNAFVAKLQCIMTQINNNAATLVDSSAKLSETALQLSSQASQTTERSSSVTSEAEQMAVRMETASKSTDEMRLNITSIANAIEELAASIQEISHNTDNANTIAECASSELAKSGISIRHLSDAAHEINTVIQTIETIAEQTNMLALNATIEAARAGEAGKGFSIVANEVKDLARQASLATEDIRRRILAIQTATEDTTRSIDGLGAQVNKVNEVATLIAAAVHEQNITTQSIAEHVSQTSTAANEINESIIDAASAGHRIRENMLVVDQSARETSQGATVTRSTGSDMQQLSDELNRAVAQFRIV